MNTSMGGSWGRGGRRNQKNQRGDGSAHAFPGGQSKPVVGPNVPTISERFRDQTHKDHEPFSRTGGEDEFPTKRSFAVQLRTWLAWRWRRQHCNRLRNVEGYSILPGSTNFVDAYVRVA